MSHEWFRLSGLWRRIWFRCRPVSDLVRIIVLLLAAPTFLLPSLGAAQTENVPTGKNVVFSYDVYEMYERENAQDRVHTIKIKGGPDAIGRVSWKLVAVDAQRGTDYEPVTKEGIIQTGRSTEHEIEIRIIDDDLVEPVEAFKIVLSNPTGSVTFPDGDTELEASVDIIDNDDFSITVDPVTVTEGDSAQFHLKLGRARRATDTATPFVVVSTGRYEQDDIAQAEPDDDYSTIKQSPDAPNFGYVSWGVNEQTKTVTVSTTQDEIDEPSEAFTLLLARPNKVDLSDFVIPTATILDNDPASVISVSSPRVQEGNVGHTAMPFSLTLDRPSAYTVTLNYIVSNASTAKWGEDFKPFAKGVLTFLPNETKKTLNVEVAGDTRSESNETVVLHLSKAGNATFAGSVATLDVTGTIVDDDESPVAVLALTGPPHNVEEGGTAVFRAELDRALTEDVSFEWRTVNGDARSDRRDFTRIFLTEAVIPAGDTGVDLKVETIRDEEAGEPKEYFMVLLRLPRSSGVVLKGSQTNQIRVRGYILDEPAVSVHDAQIVTEGRTALFPVTLSSVLATDVTVHWKTMDGRAQAGLDYTAVPDGQVTIAAGDQNATIRVKTIQDTIDEDHQEFSVTLTQVDGAAILNVDTATGVIRDDDARPRMTIDDASITEGGTARFRVKLSTASERPVSVRWQTADDTASAQNKDYVAASLQTVTIPAGDLHADIEVVTLDDKVSEGNERFKVLLSHAPDGMLKDDEAFGTIIDNEPLLVSVSPARLQGATVSLPNGQILEPPLNGSTTLLFDIRLTYAVNVPVAVDVQVLNGDENGNWPATRDRAGRLPRGDYRVAPVEPGQVQFMPGETSKTFTITVLGDALVEGYEIFRVALDTPSGASIDPGRRVSTVTIKDDSGMHFFVPAGQPHVVREGGKIRVTLERKPRDISELVKQFSSRRVEATYRVCLYGGIVDSSFDPKAVPGRAVVSGNILPSDDVLLDDVFLSSAGRGTEGNHCLIRSDAGSASVVWGRFPVDTWQQTFEIQTIQDTRVEGDETVTLLFGNRGNRDVLAPQSAFVRHEITILDDDAHLVRVENASASEGSPVEFKIYVDPPLATGETGTVNYTTADGTAQAGVDYTAQSLRQITLNAPAQTGAPAATISIPTVEDELSEVTETFTVTLSNPAVGFSLGDAEHRTATATILDNDHLLVSFENTVVAEGKDAVVTARLSQAVEEDVIVTWKTVADGAESPADFDAVSSQQLTISAGTRAASVTVATKKDNKDEFDEDFKVVATAVSPLYVHVGAAAVVTIRDRDSATLNFGGYADATTEENKPWQSATPTLTGMPFNHVTWTLEGDDAAEFKINADTGRLRLPAQNYEKQRDKDKDNVYEVIVRATDEDGTSATSSLTVRVTNVVTHVLIDSDLKVEGEDFRFNVMRESNTDVNVPITFKWRTQQDTDGENPADETDYTPVTKWKTVDMGKNSTITLSVSTTDDAVAEPSETMQVELSDLSDGKTDDVLFFDDDGQESNVAIGVILDNDQRGINVTPLTLTLGEADDPSTQEVIENQKTYEVVLTSQPTGTGTVIVNVASSDSTVATVDKSRLTFDADNWETAQMVTVTAQNDALDNTGNERATSITHTVSAADTDYADETAAPVAVTVNDDDEAPMALIVTVDTDTNTGGDQNAISEGADKPTVRVTATLDGTTRFATDKTITITVGDAEKDTATEGTGGDYATVADFDLTLPAGAASVHKDLTLTLTDDSVDEPDETISVAGELSGVTATGTVITIQDNDLTPTATLVLTPASIHESGDDTSSTVTATMDGTSSEAVTLTVSATPVTPAVAGDLTLSDTTTLTIPALSQTSTGVVTITAVDNDVDTADKTVTVAATVTGGNKLVQAPGNQTLTIKDDDTRGITVTKTTLTLDEADNAATTEANEHEDTYTVVLDSELSGGTVTIGVASGDTKIATVAPVSLTFDASDWDVPQTVTVTAVADVVDNPMDRRTVTVTHTVTATGTDYDGATAESVTVTVNDDDGEPTLSINNPSVTEMDSGATATLTFTVRLAPTSGNTVTVTYADAGTGTATSVTDYTALAGGTLTFDPGDTSKTMAITVTGDDIDEPDETVVVRLSSPVNATLTGGETTLDGTGTIEDNDPTPTVSVADATAVPEGDMASPDPPNNMTFTVTLSAASGQAVTVPYTLGGTATASTDYTAPNPRSVTIAAGQTQADVTIPVTGDEVDEANETIMVTLGTPTNATVSTAEGAGVATGTITDDDTRGISVTPTELTVAEADNPSTLATREDQATYKVVLTSQPTGAVTVNLKSGDESVARIDTAGLVFNTTNWNMERTVTVTAQPDAIDNTGNMREVDISHTVSAAGTDYTGETAESVAVTITDDDDAPTGITLTASPDSVTENGGAKTITVIAAVNGTTRYAEARTVMVSVGGGTAISGTDYAAVDSFDMTIGTGENDATKTFTLTPTNDVLDEPIEIINVTGTLSGITITGDEITLTDDDDPPSFSITGDAVVEGGKIPFTVTRSGAVDNVVSVKIATTADSGEDVSPADANDYTAIAPAQTVNFGKGVTSQTVEVQTTQDDLFEPDETFRATLSAPVLADGDPGTGVSIAAGKGTATGTIKNDDTEPSFAVADASASEGDDITFTVTRSGAMDNAVSVKWNTKVATGANAASATDYTPVPTATTLTFAKGVSSQTFTVATTEDVLDEENETFLVELTGAVGGKITTAQATGTINDDDAAPSGITLSVSPDMVNEDAGATVVTVTATVNGDTRYVDAKTVTVSVADNTAASPADYAAVSNFTITIAAGAASQAGSFTVTPVDDDLDEVNETMDVTGATTDGLTVTKATLTLTDTDDPVSFSIADAEATEGGKLTFTVTRAGAKNNVATVQVVTATDSGAGADSADAADYTALAAQRLSFAKGVTSKTVEVQTTQDDLFEPDETFLAILSAPALVDGDPGTWVSIAAGKGTATGTIKNDDTEPSFAVKDASAAEGDAITFTVTRSGAMDNAVSVKWNTKAATGANAASATDYTPVPTATTLTFAKGVSSQTFTVATTEDVLDEENETFLVELTGAVGGTITTTEATGTITDDDDAPTGITLSVDTNGAEDGTPSTVAEDAGATVVTVTATVNGPTRYVDAKTVAVSVADGTAASPADYAAVSNFNITIAAGAASQTGSFTVTPVDDDLDEVDETMDVTGTLTDVTITGATVTLTDNDDPVSFSIANAEADEGGKVIFTVSRAGAEDNVASVKVATATDSGEDVNAADADDYTAIATAQTLNFAKGVTSQTVEVQTTDDDLFEPDETFKAVLSAPALAENDPGTGVSIETGKGTATGTITNDDTEPSFAVADAKADEGDAITFTVTRSGAMDNAVSVKWNTKADSSDGANAASATDYTPVTTAITLTFAKDVGSQTFTVATTEDMLHEGNETFLVELTSPEGGTITTAEATGTITDDDAVPTTLMLAVDADHNTENVQTSLAEDGGAKTVKVTATLGGSTQFDVATTLTLIVGDDTDSATEGTDYTDVADVTLTIPAGDQAVEHTFTLTPTDDAFHETSETISFDAILASVTVTGTQITLTSEDVAPALTLTVDADKDTDNVQTSLAEDGGVKTVRVTATLDGTTRLEDAADLTLVVGKDGDSAVEGTDYTDVADQTITIRAGVASVIHDFTLTPTNDDLHEGSETISLDGTLTGITVAGTSLTITDDEVKPTVTLVLTPTAIDESGDDNASTVTATLSGKSSVAVTLAVAAAAGADTVAGDFTLSGTTLTIAAGATESTGAVTITAVDNDVDAANKSVTVSATATGGNGVANPADATLTITDDDTRGISVSPVTLTLAEVDNPSTQNTSEHQKTYSVELDSQPTGTVTVNLASGDTTIATLSDNSLEFTASDWDAQTVTVTAVADAIDNAGDARTVRITHTVSATGTDYEDETAAPMDVTVTDDDGEPTLSIDAPSVAEGNNGTATMTFKVTLTPASGKPVSVAYADATTGTATSATDYAAITGGMLNFTAGDTEKTVDVTVNGDTTDEPNETVVLRLSSPSNARLTGGAQTLDGTGTITDDDGTPVVTLKLSSASITEDGGSSTVTASLSGASHQAVTLTVAAVAVSPAAIGDYTLSANKTLTIAAGATESTGAVTVTATDNDVDADDKSVTVSATASGGGVADPSAVTLTITDDDTRGISVSPVTLTLAEVDDASTPSATEHQKTYSIELDSEPTGTVTVNLSSGDTKIATLSDISLEFTTSNWDAQTVTVTAVADDVDNTGDARTVRITHTVSATGTDYEDETAAAVDVTVTDDDDAPDGITLSVDTDKVAEDAGETSITVTATVGGGTRYAADTTVEVTVGEPTDSAVSGTDYTRVSTFDLVIPVGQASVSRAFDLTPTDDALDEADETISVTGESGSLTITGTSITLTDDDVPELSITAGSAVTEGTAAGFTVNADIAPVADLTVNLNVATTDSFAASGTTGSKTLTFRAGRTSETYTVSTQADTTDEPDGSVTVTVKGGTDYTVAASADSASVDVNDDDATTVLLARAGSGGIAENGGTEDVTITLGRALVAGESVTVPLAVTGATETTHYTLVLKGTGGTGVSLDTTDPHSAQDPAVKIEGANAQTATLTLTAVANTDNASRTVAIAYGTSARAPSSSGLSGGISTTGTASVPILDDDAMVSVAAASAAEGSAVVFTVTLPEVAPSGGVTVGYSTSDGRGNESDADHQVATSADYTAAAENATLTIAQGQRSSTISIPTTQDTTYEGDHYFTLTLDSTDTFNLSNTAGKATGTITDAADRPSFAFSTASTDADEDDGTLMLTVEKTGTTLVAATVSYATTNGTAIGGSDFTAITSTDLDFAAGAASKQITVSLTDDSADEPAEAFTVDLTASAHAQLGGTSSHTINITDNDATTVKLEAPSTAIDEDAGMKTITVTLGRALTGDETLDVPLTFSGTATFGADYTLAAPMTTPTGVTYSNLASTDLTANPPTIAFSGVSGAASSATVILTATSDITDEGATESVTVGLGTLNASSGENLDGGASGSGIATFNITDDDGTPTVTLELSSASITENGGSSTVTATLSGASSQVVTLTVAAAAVSPAIAGDFALSENTTLTIAAGATESTGAVTLTAVDNEVDAANKTVTVSATASGGGVADPSAVTLTITDDDTRGISVSPVTLTLAEVDNASTQSTSEHQETYSIELDSEPTGTVTVNLASGDTTIATLSDNSLEFTASDWDAQTVTVTAVADEIDNTGDERTVRITHTVSAAGTDYKDETAAPVDVTVTDDDGEPTLSIDAPSVAEGDSSTVTMTFKVTLTPASGKPVSVAYADATTGTATSATDYAAITSGTLNFAAGQTEKTVDVTVNGDTTDEPNETVVLRLSSPSNARLTGGAQTLDGTGTITDDDGTPSVTLKLTPTTIDESGDDNATTVTASLSGASSEAVTLTVAAAAVSPAATGDFALSGTTLTIAAGATTSTGAVTITAVDNDVDAADKSVTVSATASGGNGVANPADATLTITDDDTRGISVSPVTLTLAEVDNPSTQNTSEHQETYSIELDSEPTGTVTVNLASGDTTIATLSDNSLEFTASDWDAQTVTVTAVADTIDNAGDERTVRITHTVSAASTDYKDETAAAVDVTVTDDDGEPTLSIDAPSVAEGNNGTATMTFKVTLTPASGKPVSVAYADATTGTATSATDYAAITSGTLNFAAGQTEKTVDVTVNGDTTDEPNETVVLRLSSPSNAALSGGNTTLDGTGTITDDDATPTATLVLTPATIDESGDDNATTVTASLSGASSEAVTLMVAAAAVSPAVTGDFALSANKTLTIAAGSKASTGAVTITAVDNSVDAPNKTVTVSATASGGGVADPDDATLTITDDDAAPTGITLAVDKSTIAENAAEATVTVTASVTGGSTYSASKDLTITVGAETSTAVSDEDYTAVENFTLTLPAGASSAKDTFDLEPLDDDVDEDTETITVTGTDPGGVTVAGASIDLTDDDTRGVTVAGGSLTMDEVDNTGTSGTREDQDSYTVVLDSEPTDDVRIDSISPAMVTLSPTSLTFTPSNWNQAQTVTATAVNDTIDNTGNARTGSIAHAVVAGSSDYTGVAAASVAVTVNDDDGTPTVTLELSSASVTENGGSSTVTASLSGASSQAVTLTVAAAAVSPAATGDFALSGTTLTIAAGATTSTGAVTITAVDNDVDAADKSVTVSATASGGNGVANPADATLTITDDDTRGISVSPVTLTLAEVDNPSTQNTSEHQETYSIELDSEPTGTVTVNLASGDTTIATLSDNSLEFTASDWDAQTVTVTAVADTIDNAGDERTVRITHTVSAASTDYKDETAAAVDVTVTDDDGEPTLSIDAPSVAEGNNGTATMTFKVTLTPASGKPVSVAYADATTGTATSATDYAAITSGTLNFAAGQTEKTVDVTVNGDTTDEPNETVVLRLSSPSNAALSGGNTQTLDGTGTITDDDDAPTVSVADATAVNEGDDADTTADMSFTVTLSEASALAVTVPYTLTGTATGGSDYETPSSTSLSIPAGDTSGTIVIKVKGDTLDEPNETIIVTLGAPTNATVSTAEGAGTGTGTITDDDGTPTVTLELSSASITENGGSSTVTASLNGASHQAVTLTVAAAAVSPAATGDYTLSANTTLTIAAGATESTGAVTLTAVDNEVDAANKTVTVSATASGGGVADPSAVTLTITDDDTRGISVSPVTLTLAEVDNPSTQSTSEHQETYSVELDSEPTGTVTVNLASGDTTIATLSDNSLEFTASDWDAQTVTVTAVADAIDNTGDERTVRITHTVSAMGTDYEDETAAAVDVTVTDDDGEPTLSIDAPSVTEGDSSTATMTFKVTLTPASGKPVSVAYADATTGTATSATDYAAITSGTLNFTAGQTEKTVDVTVNGDTVDEPNETVVLRLSSPSNAALSGGAQTLDGTGTITDDDGTPW